MVGQKEERYEMRRSRKIRNNKDVTRVAVTHAVKISTVPFKVMDCCHGRPRQQ